MKGQAFKATEAQQAFSPSLFESSGLFLDPYCQKPAGLTKSHMPLLGALSTVKSYARLSSTIDRFRIAIPACLTLQA
jgi:hypothetical protein